MKIKKSICPYDCPTSCGLVIETDGKKILKVKGDENHPATQGLICRYPEVPEFHPVPGNHIPV